MTPRFQRAPRRALVADENALIRSGLRLLLTQELGDLDIVDAIDGQEMLRAARSEPALQVAVIDLGLPLLQGGAAIAEVARLRPSLPLIVVSGLNSPDMVRRASRLPTVYAVVSKAADTHELRRVMAAAMRGERIPAPAHVVTPRRLGRLTPRQDEVHRLLSQGLSNKSIAALLNIKEGTVKNHVYEIFRALKTTNRTQAAQLLARPR